MLESPSQTLGSTASLNQAMAIIRKTLSLALAISPLSAMAAWDTNLPRGVTPISEEIYDLHMLILYICCAIGVVVYGAMIYSIVAHRKSRNPTPANFSHSTAAEVTWTIVPFLILVVMAVPATKALIKMEDFSQSEISIKVTALQWRWEYDYIDEGVSFVSALDAESNAASLLNSGVEPSSVDNYLLNVDNPMVVPVGKRVQLLLTSHDVIHAWWVPELGMKRDAFPGYITRMWIDVSEPGTYRGQCAELCGAGHAYMPIVVEAVSEEDYQAWLSTRRAGSGGKAPLEPSARERAGPDADPAV